MPRLLADRIGSVDTVPLLERAADQRAVDAEILSVEGRSLAAIYLFGYEAECRIKAAYFLFYFRTYQSDQATPIDRRLRRQVTGEWQTLGLLAEPGPHDISGWAKLLIVKRRSLGVGYSPGWEQTLSDQAEQIAQRWSETLRDRANKPYVHELRVIREASAWIRHQYANL